MVKFIKTYRNYVIGDIAGFNEAREAQLVKEKFAVRAEEADMAKKNGDDGKKNPGKPQTRQTTAGPQSRK